MTEIQSWDLEKIVTDYSNKIFSSKLDLYRNVDYTALLNYSFYDFESKLVFESNELKNRIRSWNASVQGQVEDNLSFDFQKNTLSTFKVSATEHVKLSVYHKIDLIDYGFSVTLDFQELTNWDINI